MKKILFLLFATTMFATSCSNEDPIMDNSPSNNVKTYDVTFTIENKGFDVDEQPFTKALNDAFHSDIDVVVYKESGEVYATYSHAPNFPDTTGSIKQELSYVPEYSLSLKLPEGKYHVAFAYYLESFMWYTSNYFTDTIQSRYPGQANYRDDNMFLYYASVDLDVSAQSTTEPIPVILNPMWSEVQVDLDVTDFNIMPEGADRVIFGVTPDYTGLSVSTQLAPIAPRLTTSGKSSSGYTALDKNQTTYSTTYSIAKTAEENNNLKFYVKFVNGEIPNQTLISEQVYDLKTQVENGYKYKVKGTIKSDNPSQAMSISLGEFSKEDININF